MRAEICQGNLIDIGLENFHCKSRETRSVLFEERKAQGGHHYFIYDSRGNSQEGCQKTSVKYKNKWTGSKEGKLRETKGGSSSREINISVHTKQQIQGRGYRKRLIKATNKVLGKEKLCGVQPPESRQTSLWILVCPQNCPGFNLRFTYSKSLCKRNRLKRQFGLSLEDKTQKNICLLILLI